MSRSHKKVQKREVLHRVRTLQERARQVQMMRADEDARQRFDEQLHQREALTRLDKEHLCKAEGGVSMESFLRYQDLRDLHSFALNRATNAHQTAVDTLHTERAALLDAVNSRRAAERVLDDARQIFARECRYREQRSADDLTSARAMLGLGL